MQCPYIVIATTPQKKSFKDSVFELIKSMTMFLEICHTERFDLPFLVELEELSQGAWDIALGFRVKIFQFETCTGPVTEKYLFLSTANDCNVF